MKKILALLLALMMLASLVACSTKQETPAPADTQELAQSENAGTETPEQPAQPETPAEIPTVTMLTFTDWYKSGWEALTAYIDEHAEELGFRLKIDIIAGGGDTKYAAIVDNLFMWLYTIPSACISAFVLKLPPVVTFCFLKSDQILKCIPNSIVCNRYRWVRVLTRTEPKQ